MTSNEFRQIIGMKAFDDPRADELRNKNMPSQDELPATEEEMIDTENADAGDQGSSMITPEDVKSMFGG